MFPWLKPNPIIDSDTANWLIDSLKWTIETFDSRVFAQETQLILPTNTYFPGLVTSEKEMSEAVFSRIIDYAHLTSWPLVLIQPQEFRPTSQAIINGELDGRNWTTREPIPENLAVTYHPAQLNKPQDLIANLVVQISQYLMINKQSSIPVSREQWPQLSEVIGVGLGFGIQIANSAYTFKGGCGSCFNASANRQAFLTENQAIFLLALFSTLKSYKPKQVLQHLKPYLRPLYKRAMKDIDVNYDLTAMV